MPTQLAESQETVRQAVWAYQSGNAEQALTLANKALTADPDCIEALNLAGMVETRRGNTARAIQRLEKAKSLAPRFPEIAENLAAAYCSAGDLRAAIDIYEEALTSWPDRIGAWCNLGNLLSETGDPEGARSAYQRALNLKPDFLTALVNLALLEGQSGNTQRAVDLYRRSLSLAPNNGEIHHDFARVKRFSPGDPNIAAMEKRSAERPGDSADRMFFDFALAKAYEDSGDYSRAFQHLAAGNAAKRRRLTFEIEEQNRRVDTIIDTFSPHFLSRNEGAGFPSERPIFVFGMPRSGTSLVEQILASHPAVAGAGELGLLKETVVATLNTLGLGQGAARDPYPARASSLTTESLRQLGETYVGNLPVNLGPCDHVTDKMPGNFEFAGVIRLSMPRARMIHCRRSPLDTCLSCYFIHFPYGQEFSYDLTELGLYYRAYDRLMRHWNSLLGDALLDVDYEDVVSDSEAATRRILAFCGLPWNDACLAFHTTRRRIKTASSQQVRQPVYKTAVHRWQRFEDHLGPLIDALGDLADVKPTPADTP